MSRSGVLDANAGDPFDKGEAFMLLEPAFKPLKFPAKARIEDGLAKGGVGAAAQERIGYGGGRRGGDGGSRASTPPPGASKGLRESLERSRAKRPKQAPPPTPPRDRKTPSRTPASAGRLSLSELRTPSAATPASAGPLSLSDLRTPTRRSSGKKKATKADLAAESAEAEREQLSVRDRLEASERRFRKAQQKFTETHTRRQAASQKKRKGGGRGRGRGRGRGKGKGIGEALRLALAEGRL
jgi:hypothetical protein